MGWQEELRVDGAELELFYAHLTLGKCPGEEEGYVEHLASTLPLSEATRQHLLSCDPNRLLIYRQLTRATHERVIRTAIPRAAARMGDAFQRVFEEFLATQGTSSHFLRDLTPAFIRFARASSVETPAYIFELAELEAIRIQVAAAPDTSSAFSLDLDLGRGLLFTEAARLLSFEYAVHELSENEEDRTVPQQRPTTLLSYRSAENTVRYLELSPLAAQVIRSLINGEALGDAVSQSCRALGQELSDEVLVGTAQVLSDLADRHVIVGVR